VVKREFRLGRAIRRSAGVAALIGLLLPVPLHRRSSAQADRDGPEPSVEGCFPPGLSAEEYERASEAYGLRNPTLLGVGDRFALSDMAWLGDNAQIGLSGQALPVTLTYSFPDDSVAWGNPEISLFGPNLLGLRLVQIFGVGNLDLGREYLRQAIAGWQLDSGVTLAEAPDDNSPIDTDTARSPSRGDLRMGGIELGLTPLAFNFFPPFGGDMVFNTRRFFEVPTLSDATGDYRALRNTTVHEMGHGLGLFHVTPCNETKLMEPFISTGFENVQVDDVRGAGANYGDRLAPNQSPAEAHDLGDLSAPILRSVREGRLSTNGASGPNSTGEDWFSFSLSSTHDVEIIADPTGGMYFAARQTSDCLPEPDTPLDAEAAGDLTVELWNSDATVLIASAVAAPPGSPEILQMPSMAPGTYLVRVADIGPNDPFDGVVQLYDLTVEVDGVPPSPVACAGVDKLIPVGQTCFFIGDINSRPNAPATFINSTGYDWDLDGDGLFEVIGEARPTRVYTQPETVEVKLRVTDSNSRISTDTIRVTAYEPSLAILSVSPTVVEQDTLTPIVISGTGLGPLSGLTASSFTSSGLSLTGTPVISQDGTMITGLSVSSEFGAQLGPTNLTLEAPGLSVTGAGVIEIEAPANPRPGPFSLLDPVGGTTTPTTTPTFDWEDAPLAESYTFTLDVDVDDDGAIDQNVVTVQGLAQSQYTPPLGLLTWKRPHRWSVKAVNASGETESTPSAWVFRTPTCFGDSDYSQNVEFTDITVTLTYWLTTYPAGRSGLGDSDDTNWLNQCP